MLKKFAARSSITFALLSDEGSRVIDAYGIRNKAFAGRKRMDGIPHPGTFVLDGKGVIRAKLFLDSYRERHSSAEIIKAAELTKSESR